MSVSPGEFLALLALTGLLVLWGAYWRRKNLQFIRAVGEVLETVLRPRHQRYTWLGGVIGFSAEFKTDAFGVVRVVFTTLPRQSLLYLPLAWVLGRRDRLELLIMMKQDPHLKATGDLLQCDYDETRRSLYLRFRVRRKHLSELEALLRKVLNIVTQDTVRQ